MLSYNALPREGKCYYKVSILLLGLFITCIFSSCENEKPSVDTEPIQIPTNSLRIVSLNGTITELLYTLGYGDQLVGVDVTSVYPPQVNQIAKLGHIQQLNTEALLELQPDLVFVDSSSAKQESLQQLTGAGIKIVLVPNKLELDNAIYAAETLSTYLPVDKLTITQLKQKLKADQQRLDSVLTHTSIANSPPKVLFIYARGTNRLMVAGKHTSAERMIQFAGGTNAITSFDDFQALTPESLLSAAPDAILMFTSGLASLDGLEGLSQVPGISQTPAYQNQRVIAMDGDYLLNFGPRIIEAATDLATRLHTITPIQ